VTAAARVVALADGRTQSPLESLTRLCLIDAGLSQLEPQSPIDTERGTYSVDLLLLGTRVIVEADGRLKYRKDDALWREKLRQEAIERADYRVVRVTWDDVVRRPDETIRRVRNALSATLAKVQRQSPA
jgi:very-short-patch-repair endonuclease